MLRYCTYYGTIGDIKVVAGMGDSITSGLGANSTNMADMATQYRGHSFR